MNLVECVLFEVGSWDIQEALVKLDAIEEVDLDLLLVTFFIIFVYISYCDSFFLEANIVFLNI